MRSYDTIIARLILASMIGFGLAGGFLFLNLFQQYGLYLFLIESLLLLITFSFTVHQIYKLKQERAAIEAHLDELESSGTTIFRKKFERLLYSRDVADIPKIARLAFDFNTLAIIQPTTHTEIRQVIHLCEKYDIPLIPRGTGTGGYGGALPIKNGIILNLFRLNSILGFDSEQLIVEAESGITWRRLREYLKPKGFDVPVYPSSAPSSTIGGWVSSGGYGIGSSKYGDISQNTIGGTLIGTKGKEILFNSSPSITGNFGSLGVIWKIKLRIIPIKPIHHLALAPSTLHTGIALLKGLLGYTPYYMRYIDQKNIEWARSEEKQSLPDTCESSNGLIAVSYESDEYKSSNITSLLKESSTLILSDSCAQELWEDRFYTLRLKRKGPSLIIAEVLVPTDNLDRFLQLLDSWFKAESFTFEIVSTQEKYSMIMVWFPTDQRRWNLPVIGSVSYLFRWFRTFQVIRLAWKVKGTTYNNGGLWLSMYPKKENYEQLAYIKKMKLKSDPNNIFNPGKIISPRIPRFFPLITWSFAVKIGVPIISFLYRFLPKRIR
jgi:FAD/FMN-containing dehydrogenase